jgi:signal transduction histidine kinase
MRDLALALLLALVSAIELATGASHGAALESGLVAAGAMACVAISLRRRVPGVATVAGGLAWGVPGVVIGATWWNGMPDAIGLAELILAFTAGWLLSGPISIVGLASTAVGFNGGEVSGSAWVFWLVFVLPAWVTGTVMRSRETLLTQLAERAAELASERSAFAREAVRYERARIARDLHDIVAHEVSLIVVQAGGARGVIESDPAAAAASFEHIAVAAHQAQSDVGRLLRLLSDDVNEDETGTLGGVGELVRSAAAAGLDVSYVVRGEGTSNLPVETAETIFRVTQEGITNALKHAPGATIEICVTVGDKTIQTSVRNGESRGEKSGLEATGGGNGIPGLRDRVARLGGALSAGGQPDGTWCLDAEFPRQRVLQKG